MLKLNPFDLNVLHRRLVKIAKNNLNLFSKEGLAARKQKQSANAGEWLPKFLEDVYEPKAADFRKMRAFVDKYRRIYNEKYRDIRHKTIAHLELAEHQDIQALYGKTNVTELGTLLFSMMRVYDVLWELYYNGRQPQWEFVLPSVEEVVKDNKSYRTSAGKLPERAVLDAQAVVRSIGDRNS